MISVGNVVDGFDQFGHLARRFDINSFREIASRNFFQGGYGCGQRFSDRATKDEGRVNRRDNTKQQRNTDRQLGSALDCSSVGGDDVNGSCSFGFDFVQEV